jgi:hypothetical protein
VHLWILVTSAILLLRIESCFSDSDEMTASGIAEKILLSKFTTVISERVSFDVRKVDNLFCAQFNSRIFLQDANSFGKLCKLFFSSRRIRNSVSLPMHSGIVFNERDGRYKATILPSTVSVTSETEIDVNLFASRMARTTVESSVNDATTGNI